LDSTAGATACAPARGSTASTRAHPSACSAPPARAAPTGRSGRADCCGGSATSARGAHTATARCACAVPAARVASAICGSGHSTPNSVGPTASCCTLAASTASANNAEAAGRTRGADQTA